MTINTGDRVTCSLAPGEWIVKNKEFNAVDHTWIRGDTGLGSPGDICVPTATLTKVTDPEPPPGSVVFVDGKPIRHSPYNVGSWYWIHDHQASPLFWSDISERSTLAVPLADVVKFIDQAVGYQTARTLESHFDPTKEEDKTW